MTPVLAIAIALLALCVGLQAFFSGSELALVSANRARLQADADGGSQGAGLALDLLSEEDRLLGTCLIGTNLCLVSATTENTCHGELLPLQEVSKQASDSSSPCASAVTRTETMSHVFQVRRLESTSLRVPPINTYAETNY